MTPQAFAAVCAAVYNTENWKGRFSRDYDISERRVLRMLQGEASIPETIQRAMVSRLEEAAPLAPQWVALIARAQVLLADESAHNG